MIHLNNAGAGIQSTATYEAMVNYLALERELGGYEAEQFNGELLDVGLYQALADFLGAQSSDIAIYENATRAWLTALHCMHDVSADDEIWVTPFEYAGNLIALSQLQKTIPFTLRTIPLDDEGDIDVSWMQQNLHSNVAMVSITYVPSGCGIVNPVEKIGQCLAGHPAIYMVDACQAVGQLEIDVTKIGCDVLTAAGRKFICGPRGTAFSYLSERFRQRYQPQDLDLHTTNINAQLDVSASVTDARRFELCERNISAMVGLFHAVTEITEDDFSHVAQLSHHLYARMAELSRVMIVKPGRHQQGILTFVHESLTPKYIVAELKKSNINAWVAIGSHTPIYMANQGIDHMVRLSVSRFNSIEDIDACYDALISLK